jgi:hypothetical protein
MSDLVAPAAAMMKGRFKRVLAMRDLHLYDPLGERPVVGQRAMMSAAVIIAPARAGACAKM